MGCLTLFMYEVTHEKVCIEYRAETAGEDPRPDHGGYQYNPRAMKPTTPLPSWLPAQSRFPSI